jgi:hypothetical protein
VRLGTTSSLAANASPTLAARVAPAATSLSAREAVRFHAVTGRPAARTERTIACPIGARPMTVTPFVLIFAVLSSCSRLPEPLSWSSRTAFRRRTHGDAGRSA